MIAPIIDELAKEQTAVKVGKVNVNDAPELAAQFGVLSIPLVVLVKGGEVVAQAEGFSPNQKEVLLAMIAANSSSDTKKPLAKVAKGEASTTVTDKNTAKAVGSGDLDVFATPMMIALMEEAACNAIASSLKPGQSSVGTMVNVTHIAASGVGTGITAEATIVAIDGRKIEFSVTAKDGEKEIGSGTHTRYIVDVERFMGKLS